MKKTILIFMAVSLLTGSLFAKANMKLVDEYLNVSGTKEIILALPKQIEKGYLSNIDDKNLKKIDIKNNFDPKQTIDYVKLKLSQEFNDDLLKGVIVYYKSPLGQKFKNSGLKAINKKNTKQKKSSYERLRVMNSFVDKLELSPISVHLIGELLGSINADLVSSNNPQDVIGGVSEKIKNHMLEASLIHFSNFTEKELKSVMAYYYTNTGRFEQLIVSGIFKQLIMESFLQILEQSRQKTAS